jgi:hypothetical protein
MLASALVSGECRRRERSLGVAQFEGEIEVGVRTVIGYARTPGPQPRSKSSLPLFSPSLRSSPFCSTPRRRVHSHFSAGRDFDNSLLPGWFPGRAGRSTQIRTILKIDETCRHNESLISPRHTEIRSNKRFNNKQLCAKPRPAFSGSRVARNRSKMDEGVQLSVLSSLSEIEQAQGGRFVRVPDL